MSPLRANKKTVHKYKIKRLLSFTHLTHDAHLDDQVVSWSSKKKESLEREHFNKSF